MKEKDRPITILIMWQPMWSESKTFKEPRTSNEIGTICIYLDVYNGVLQFIMKCDTSA